MGQWVVGERAGFDARLCMASDLALFLASPPPDSERHTGNPDLLTNTPRQSFIKLACAPEAL
jgi:hypothetical protein